jgi:hypothetical protein
MYHNKVVVRGSLAPNPGDDQLVSDFHDGNVRLQLRDGLIRSFGSLTAKVLRCLGARGQRPTEVA